MVVMIGKIKEKNSYWIENWRFFPFMQKKISLGVRPHREIFRK